MDSSEEAFAGLLPEIIERVLSLLPVPFLCRLRCVCKAWNEILCKPSFHNMRDLNEKRESYVFLAHYMPYVASGGGDHAPEHRIDRRRTTFLDVGARRWYTILTDDQGSCGDEFDIVSVVMNDGLVCVLAWSSGDGGHYALFVADPVANIRRKLPALPVQSWEDDESPAIVVSVDNASLTLLVYFLVCTNEAERKMYVYESPSSKWRALASPPEETQLAYAGSAVLFHGILYVTFNAQPFLDNTCCLLSYNLQEDTWRIEHSR